VRLDVRLGNVVLLTPLLQALRSHFPDAHLGMVLARRYWAMRPYLSVVDEFIPFERRELARNPIKIRSFIKRIRAGKFDFSFDASDDRQPSFNHMMTTALSGSPFRIGHARGDAARYYEVSVPIPNDARHASQMHVDLLRALVPVGEEPRPVLTSPPSHPEETRIFKERHGIPQATALVLLHPGGRGPKRWTAEGWAAVAGELHGEHGASVGLVWGPSDEDAAQAVISLAGEAVRPIGVLPLAEFMPALSHANVFLSGDCGPMHVASALGTPVVAVFLVSEAEKYRPMGVRDVVIDARHRAFEPGDVAKAVRQVLETRG
jgi:ADP-heptose:LPS heptosyltransferase